MNKLKKLTSFTLAIALTGCGLTTPSTNLNLLSAEPLLDVENMPTKEQLNGKPLSILTIAAKTDNKIVNQYKLNEQLPSKIEAKLVEGGANTVDRSLAAKLIDEIELAEETGNYGFYKGPKVSDLVVVAKLSNATFTKVFQEAKSYKNKDGQSVYIPARCTHTAKVQGFVKVMRLPNMNLIENIPFENIELKNTDTRNSGCPISNQAIADLLSDAMADAFNSGATSAKVKSIAAANAYVVEKKVDGKTTFFKTTLKKSLGATEGQTVRLYMSDAETGELLYIGDGTITSGEYITERYSYIYVNDPKNVPLVRKGMVVKIYEECGFGCQMSDATDGVNAAAITDLLRAF